MVTTSSYRPADTWGDYITVTVVRGQGFKERDLFLAVSLSGNQYHHTAKIADEANPYWGESFRFYPNECDAIHLCVSAHTDRNRQEPIVVGQGGLELKEVLPKLEMRAGSNAHIEETIKLTHNGVRTGAVQLHLSAGPHFKYNKVSHSKETCAELDKMDAEQLKKYLYDLKRQYVLMDKQYRLEEGTEIHESEAHDYNPSMYSGDNHSYIQSSARQTHHTTTHHHQYEPHHTTTHRHQYEPHHTTTHHQYEPHHTTTHHHSPTHTRHTHHTTTRHQYESRHSGTSAYSSHLSHRGHHCRHEDPYHRYGIYDNYRRVPDYRERPGYFSRYGGYRSDRSYMGHTHSHDGYYSYRADSDRYAGRPYDAYSSASRDMPAGKTTWRTKRTEMTHGGDMMPMHGGDMMHTSGGPMMHTSGGDMMHTSGGAMMPASGGDMMMHAPARGMMPTSGGDMHHTHMADPGHREPSRERTDTLDIDDILGKLE